MKKENKKNNNKKDGNISSYLLVFALVLVLGGGTVFFLYRPSKPSSSTRINSVEDNYVFDENAKPSTTTIREEEKVKEEAVESKQETQSDTQSQPEKEKEKEPTEYMKVSVDTDSENKTKAAQKKEQQKKAESKTVSETPKPNNKEIVDELDKQVNKSDGNSSSGREEKEPTVINYYYTDKNGNQTQTPSKNGETVYIIDKGSQSTSLSDEQIRAIIDNYLKQTGDTQIVASGTDKDLAQNVSNQTGGVDITGDGGEPDAININGGDANTVDITGDDAGPAGSSDTQSNAPAASSSSKQNDSGTPSYAGLQVIGRLWTDNYGRVMANSLSVAPSKITSIEWHERRVGGEAYLIDTDDIFTKEVYVSDGAAIEVYAIATYKDGATRTSNTCIIKHINYRD